MRATTQAQSRAQIVTPTRPKVRATGILVEDGCVLLVRQCLHERSHWNLPGGALELGETLGECLVREMAEETGLRVEMGELLYVTDRFKSLGGQVLDLSFLVHRVQGSTLRDVVSPDGERIAGRTMVPIAELPRYGMSQRFASLAAAGFPDRGSYQGDFHVFYRGELPQQGHEREQGQQCMRGVA